MKKLLLLIPALTMVTCLAAEKLPAPPIIVAEDFSNPAAAIQNFNLKSGDWAVANGELRTVNAIGRSIFFEFGDADWNDYEIEFKVRRLKVSPTDQHFGIFVRNSPSASVQLYCRGDSFRYIADSRHEILGILPQPLAAGQDVPWTAFRIVVKGTWIKVYVDHTLLGTLGDVAPAVGKIKIYAYDVELALKDLNVMVTQTGEKNTTSDAASKNILHNSSFEQCTLDDLPDFWGCPHWGLADGYWATRFEEWQKHFITDKTMAYDGKRSMKIANPNDLPSHGLTLWSVCVGATSNEKYTLSAYMKSEPAGLKVQLGNGPPGQGKVETVSLTEKWQRYTTTFVKDGNNLYADMVNIIPQNKGTVWIDAVQLEKGPLTVYQPLKNETQQLEIQEGNVNKVLTEVPKYQSPYYKHQLTISGKLDDAIWKQVPTMKFVTLSGDTVKEPTEAQIWYNDRGIYVGVKCFDRNADKNKCGVTVRDGNIWRDPSLELFIDPQLSRNNYYHLAVNQRGVQCDGVNGDMSWNGDWKAVTYTDPVGKYWSAEIFLPFGELGIDRAAGDWWGFNIVRNNYSQQEVSCWSPTYGSPHTPTRFGQIYIDSKIQENYYTGCSGAQFQSLSANSAALAVKIYNNTRLDQGYNLSARLFDQKNRQVAEFSQPIKLKEGGEQTIELGKVNYQAGMKYCLSLNLRSNDNKILCFSGVKELETPAAFAVQTQYDLYTREDKMLVRIQLNLFGELLAGAQLTLKIKDSTGKEVLKRFVDKPQPEMETEIGIGNLENGDYVLNAELETGDGTLAVSKEFRKLPPAKNEVKADHFSRMVVVNGKPFFPVGIYVAGNADLECVKYYAENGVNSLWTPFKDYSITKKFLDCAAENNIKVLLDLEGPKRDNDKNEYGKIMQMFQDHPAILGWRFYDEAFTIEWGKNNYPFILSVFKEFQRMEPYHPLVEAENSYGLSFLNNSKRDYPGAIILVDYYAYPPASSLQLVSTYAKSMEKIGRTDGKPCWMYLFGGGYTFWASRDLTPAEQEFETYAAIINGIRGINYFGDHPKSKSHWGRMKELFREIKELTPILASTIKAPVVKCNTPAIEFLVKKTGDGVCLIAVNNTTEVVNARFDLSEAGVQNGDVLFEGRAISVSHRAIEDNFNGLQRHVYLLK